VLLREDNSIELADPPAQGLLAELGHEGGSDGRPPVVVQAAADRARVKAAGSDAGGSTATARVRTRSGRWLTVRGSVLGTGPEARAAVILEPARLPELAPLIADAYGLTPRERAITQLVARGFSTGEISDRLFLSPYTVQDHLKSIFEKTDVGSRGALVARLFFEHYAPRLATESQVRSDGWFTDASQN
jgi:DNA-binding CsgD family transcriptional regulator